jgi:hypothetical protein
MAHIHVRNYIPLLLFSLLFPAAAFDEKTDLEILRKAFEKSLGETTNYGLRRLGKLEKSSVEGKRVLFVAVQVNRHVTAAGVRHNALADVAAILRVAKSWGWADKVERVVIVESLIPDGEERARPVLSCSISNEALAKVERASLTPEVVSKHLEHVRFYEVK